MAVSCTKSLRRPDLRQSRGAAAVEFALLLPVFFLLIAGVVDFGRAFFTQIELTNAAREGARAAVVSVTSADVASRARASAPSLPAMTVNTTMCAGPASNATVRAGSAFQWLMLQPALSLFGAGAALPATLSSSAVMRCSG